MPEEATDSELALRAAAGDRAAFAVLVVRHYDRVYRLAWRWCGVQAQAEDVAQDVMVKMATAMKSFRGDSAFSTWAYRIAYTTAVDHLRAGAKIVPFSQAQIAELNETAGDATPEDMAMDNDLWRSVRALPDQQRDAVLLVYGQDMSHGEAAELMGCSEKTVSWHLHEAKRRLRISLEAV